MPETVKPLLPVQINYTCDECGEGVMVVVPNKGLSLVDSRQAAETVHECSHCQHQQSFTSRYPYIHYTDFFGFINDSNAVIQQLAEQRGKADNDG